MPTRVQLQRTRGVRKPPNTQVVTRSTAYGNPYRVLPPDRDNPSWRIWTCGGRGGSISCDRIKYADPFACASEHDAHERAVRLFRVWLTAPEQADVLDRVRRELAGLDLACWCRLDMPCHADVLLELANHP
jgi:hypothetical protein